MEIANWRVVCDTLWVVKRVYFCGFAFVVASQAFAVTLNSPETFENGGTGQWSGGVSFSNVMDAPSGGGTRALEVSTSTRLALYNQTTDYAGDFLTAGVTGVRVWMRNPGNLPLSMRLVLHSGNQVDRWTSSSALTLAAGSDWTLHTFSVASSDLLHVQGSQSYAESMGDVWRVMFRHDVTGSANGTNIPGGVVRLDNIEVVPEPATISALAVGLLGVRRRFKRAANRT